MSSCDVRLPLIGDRWAALADDRASGPGADDLATGRLPFDPGKTSSMRAVCTGDAGRQRLVFFLNGEVVAQIDDTEDPFTTGGVGLGVAVGEGDNAIVAEFDNFTVRDVES